MLLKDLLKLNNYIHLSDGSYSDQGGGGGGSTLEIMPHHWLPDILTGECASTNIIIVVI